MPIPTSELSCTVALKTLENGPRTIDIEATTDECNAIAKRLAVNSLSNLEGSITLEIPAERDPLFDGLAVMGHGKLKATLSQACVVTLEVFEITIESEFEGAFCNSDPVDAVAVDDEEEISHLPEILGPLGEESLEIGEVFIEQLALEIDPFPRKPGAEFEGFTSGKEGSGEAERKNPFAVLEKLKDNLE